MFNYRGVLAGENFKAVGLAIGILFSVGLADLSAQDVSGTWILSVDLGASGAGDATFVFEQDGNDLSIFQLMFLLFGYSHPSHPRPPRSSQSIYQFV